MRGSSAGRIWLKRAHVLNEGSSDLRGNCSFPKLHPKEFGCEKAAVAEMCLICLFFIQLAQGFRPPAPLLSCEGWKDFQQLPNLSFFPEFLLLDDRNTDMLPPKIAKGFPGSKKLWRKSCLMREVTHSQVHLAAFSLAVEIKFWVWFLPEGGEAGIQIQADFPHQSENDNGLQIQEGF